MIPDNTDLTRQPGWDITADPEDPTPFSVIPETVTEEQLLDLVAGIPPQKFISEPVNPLPAELAVIDRAKTLLQNSPTTVNTYLS